MKELVQCVRGIYSLNFRLSAIVVATGFATFENVCYLTQNGAVQGLHGATLLTESTGGYVLVGVAAFTAAVVLTILCMHLHERDKRNGEKREENT